MRPDTNGSGRFYLVREVGPAVFFTQNLSGLVSQLGTTQIGPDNNATAEQYLSRPGDVTAG